MPPGINHVGERSCQKRARLGAMAPQGGHTERKRECGDSLHVCSQCSAFELCGARLVLLPCLGLGPANTNYRDKLYSCTSNAQALSPWIQSEEGTPCSNPRQCENALDASNHASYAYEHAHFAK
eukprot:1800482-Karenia_brevis.AAC.1